jgi:hypothetical protein
MSTVKARDYCDLIYVEADTYTNMVEQFELQASIGQAVLLQAKSRQARLRWKRAIQKVRMAIRWKRNAAETRRRATILLPALPSGQQPPSGQALALGKMKKRESPKVLPAIVDDADAETNNAASW